MSRPSYPPRAPAANRRAVHDSSWGGHLLTPTGKELPRDQRRDAEQQLFLFRQALLSTDAVPLDDISTIAAASKPELVQKATALFHEHIDPNASELSLHHAALAGVAVSVAFLEVTTRLVAREPLALEALPSITKKSVMTPLELATHSHTVDGQLTHALSTYTSREIRQGASDKLMENLSFKPDFFSLDSQKGVVSVDYSKQPLMTVKGHRIDFMPRNEALFGCPYYSHIGRLYTNLTQAAFTNGLLEHIYDEEQANA